MNNHCKFLFGVCFLLGIPAMIAASGKCPAEEPVPDSIRISKETTFLTEPKTEDGKWIDYQKILGKHKAPKKTRSEDNGYRFLVQKLGLPKPWMFLPEEISDWRVREYYEQLDLDPEGKPEFTYEPPYVFLLRKINAEGKEDAGNLVFEMEQSCSQPWTAEDCPLMEQWIQEYGAVLDLLKDALDKPYFCAPSIQGENSEPVSDFEAMQFFRELVRGFLVRINFRIGKGEIEAAMEDITVLEKLSQRLYEQEFLGYDLLALAFQGLSMDRAIAGGSLHSPSEEQLERLRDQGNRVSRNTCRENAKTNERLVLLDTIQCFAKKTKNVAKYLKVMESAFLDHDFLSISEGRVEEPPEEFPGQYTFDYNIVMQRINRIFDGDFRPVPEPEEQLELFFRGEELLDIQKRSEILADLLAVPHLDAIQSFDSAVRRNQCCRNLRQIGLCMLIYEKIHGHLPPGASLDENGQPLHNWTVLLLPYLGDEKAKQLYDQIRLEEPWDSEYNRQFHELCPDLYRCPSCEFAMKNKEMRERSHDKYGFPLDDPMGPGDSVYVVILGEKTLFPPDASPRNTAEVRGKDSLARILVAETISPRNWMNPYSNIPVENAMRGIRGTRDNEKILGSLHSGGINVVFSDGSAGFISSAISFEVLEEHFTGSVEE